MGGGVWRGNAGRDSARREASTADDTGFLLRWKSSCARSGAASSKVSTRRRGAGGATERRPVIGALLGLVGVLAFSGTTVATRILVRQVGPVLAGAGRELIAGIFALCLLVLTRIQRPSGRQWIQVAMVSAGVVVAWPLLMSLALEDLSAPSATVMIGALPAVTGLYAAIRERQRPSFAFWSASATGVVAVAVFAVIEGSGPLHGADWLLLAAGIACGVGYGEGAILAGTLGSTSVLW